MTDEKILLLKMHACSNGLDDVTLQEIATHAELIYLEPEESIHQAGQVLESVYLVVQGRIKVSALDMHGNELMQRVLRRGEQFGGLGSALAEPVPITATSYGSSILLRFDYSQALQLTLKYPQFRKNMTKIVAQDARQLVFGKKHRKQATLIAFFHQSESTREITYKIINRLVSLGENPCLFTDSARSIHFDNVRTRSLLERDSPLNLEQIRQQINDWPDAKRIIIDVNTHKNVIDPLSLLIFCEQIYWCFDPSHYGHLVQQLQSIKKRFSIWKEKVSIVWLLEDNQSLAPAVPELRQLAIEDFKVAFDQPSYPYGGQLNLGIERIVHHLRGIRIGLALGGGAARGMAHLGVLKALEQSGVVIDRIAGTSAGAMTGTVYCAGYRPDFLMDRFNHDLKPSRLFQLLPRGKQWFLLYKYRLGQFDPMLRKYIPGHCLEQLHIPIHTVTVDLVNGEPVIRNTGDAVHAILESINLPVLSAPICRSGKLLVDGGLVNNVPADVLAHEGCNFIIAVSVTAKLENRIGRNNPDTPTECMKSPSTLQTILRSYVVQSMNMNSIGVQQADIVIEPDVTNYELTDFESTKQLADIGEQTTLEAMPKIKELLAKLDSQVFRF